MPLLTPKNKRFWMNVFALLAMAIAIGLLVAGNMENNQPRQVSSLATHTDKIPGSPADKISQSDKIKDK